MIVPQQNKFEQCIPQETCIENVFLAAAYVPFQKFCGVWPPIMSLLTGTAFPELYSPYQKREYVNLEPEVTCPGVSPYKFKGKEHRYE